MMAVYTKDLLKMVIVANLVDMCGQMASVRWAGGRKVTCMETLGSLRVMGLSTRKVGLIRVSRESSKEVVISMSIGKSKIFTLWSFKKGGGIVKMTQRVVCIKCHQDLKLYHRDLSNSE